MTRVLPPSLLPLRVFRGREVTWPWRSPSRSGVTQARGAVEGTSVGEAGGWPSGPQGGGRPGSFTRSWSLGRCLWMGGVMSASERWPGTQGRNRVTVRPREVGISSVWGRGGGGLGRHLLLPPRGSLRGCTTCDPRATKFTPGWQRRGCPCAWRQESPVAEVVAPLGTGPHLPSAASVSLWGPGGPKVTAVGLAGKWGDGLPPADVRSG